MTVTPARSAYRLPGMDCPTEEQLVRGGLSGEDAVRWVRVSLPARTVVVGHAGRPEPIDDLLDGLGLGAQRLTGEDADAALATMGDAPDADEQRQERSALFIALGLNLVGFVVGVAGGLGVGSTAVLADGVDMGGDVVVYVMALLAVGAGAARQRLAARTMGALMAVLAVSGVLEVVRRVVTDAPPPDPIPMALLASVGLIINIGAMLAVRRVRTGGQHVQSMWVMTSTDVQANLVVIGAAGLVALTGVAVPDLIVGTLVFGVVARGALRVLRGAR